MKRIRNKENPKPIKKKHPRNKKQKAIMWTVVGFTIVNFLAVLAFFIYLYFWLKGR